MQNHMPVLELSSLSKGSNKVALERGPEDSQYADTQNKEQRTY